VIAVPAAELAVVFEESASVNMKGPAERAMLVDTTCSRVLIVSAHFGSYTKLESRVLYHSFFASGGKTDALVVVMPHLMGTRVARLL
jgi:hypothetical protein